MLERHLEWIGRRFEFVPLDEIESRLAGGGGFRRPAAALTFDDGYADVYEQALPLLKTWGVPAAIFVVTDLIGSSQIPLYDRLYLALVRAVGARHLRFAVGWDSTEVEPGKYDWSAWDALFGLLREAGVTPLPYVCYTPRWLTPSDPKDFWRRPADPRRFARFVSALVERYRGQAPSWELWNEPDNELYWLGTAEQFARLVEAGARAVRTADPAARVVLGGMSKGRSPFLYIRSRWAQHRFSVAPENQLVGVDFQDVG